MARKKNTEQKNSKSAALGFEEKLWAAADKLRGHMDAGEYKHVVLGLLFLKYISDAFQEYYEKLAAESYANPVPLAPIAQRFGDSVKPLMAMIRAISGESRTLAAIRDALLPKLMSREIRVKEAEKILEDVA